MIEFSPISLVILAGGEGSRFKNSSIDMPKVLAPIGGKPILWHIIKHYEHYGIRHVILCLGSQYEIVSKKMNLLFKESDIKLECIDTGDLTPTGGRISAIAKYVQSEDFFVTYGDGLGSVPIDQLYSYHKGHAKLATVTVVRRESQFGHVLMNEENLVTNFEEKPLLPYWINAGFFVFKKGIFNFLKRDSVLETTLFRELVKENTLMSFKHTGFWKCMDTVKENMELEEIWQKGNYEWKVR